MKKIVVASDSFKGSVTSMEVARAASEGIHKACPECETVCVPVGDGGEDTVTALVEARKGRLVECEVLGPLMEPLRATYGLLDNGRTAVIEMASCAGLTLIPPSRRNPMLTTTYGVGQMIADALARGCRDFLVCIGGSATNDAGIGMLAALGFRFLDASGHEVSGCGGSLDKITDIDFTRVNPALSEARFTVACDVQNPFYGPQGAACVFAPQKGADNFMVAALDRGLRSFAEVVEKNCGKNIAPLPGAGAAGGLGGGMVAFLDATLKPGIEMVLDAIGFDRLIAGADMVITGEGRLDSQTVMGKTPYGVMLRARRQHIPVVAIGGCVTETEALVEAGFKAVLPIVPYPVELSRAMDKDFACRNITRTVEQIIRLAVMNKKLN